MADTESERSSLLFSVCLCVFRYGLHVAFNRIPPSTADRLQLVTVLDVDILVNSSYFDLVRRSVRAGANAVMFAILRDAEGRAVHVDDYSTGMINFAREDALRAGGLSSAKYILRTEWGDEDNDIIDRLRLKAGVSIEKVVNRGMLHRKHMRDWKDPWYCRTYWARGKACPTSPEQAAAEEALAAAEAKPAQHQQQP
jgi:hypothetical protein